MSGPFRLKTNKVTIDANAIFLPFPWVDIFAGRGPQGHASFQAAMGRNRFSVDPVRVPAETRRGFRKKLIKTKAGRRGGGIFPPRRTPRLTRTTAAATTASVETIREKSNASLPGASGIGIAPKRLRLVRGQIDPWQWSSGRRRETPRVRRTGQGRNLTRTLPERSARRERGGGGRYDS